MGRYNLWWVIGAAAAGACVVFALFWVFTYVILPILAFLRAVKGQSLLLLGLTLVAVAWGVVGGVIRFLVPWRIGTALYTTALWLRFWAVRGAGKLLNVPVGSTRQEEGGRGGEPQPTFGELRSPVQMALTVFAPNVVGTVGAAVLVDHTARITEALAPALGGALTDVAMVGLLLGCLLLCLATPADFRTVGSACWRGDRFGVVARQAVEVLLVHAALHFYMAPVPGEAAPLWIYVAVKSYPGLAWGRLGDWQRPLAAPLVRWSPVDQLALVLLYLAVLEVLWVVAAALGRNAGALLGITRAAGAAAADTAGHLVQAGRYVAQGRRALSAHQRRVLVHQLLVRRDIEHRYRQAVAPDLAEVLDYAHQRRE